METMEVKLRHWRDLTDEEVNAIHNPRDIPIISIIGGLSHDERKVIYDQIKIRRKYFKDFMDRQGVWLDDHKWYIGEDLERNHRCEDPNDILTNEVIAGDGENVRFRIYYAVKCTQRIEGPPYSPELSDFLNEVYETVEY
ncbi:MAG: hypothetical protein WAU65_00310 [Candidatus Nanoarchaeia archaeon]